MGKVILKTALKTLLIIIFLALAAIAVASFGFPQHMATFFENAESYSIATKYASLRYTYTGDVDDAARCVMDSIYSGDSDNIIKYSEILIGHDDFESYCTQMDVNYSTGKYSEYTLSYKQYIYGKYSIALAAVGEKQEAVDQAFIANGMNSFQKGNALATLAVWAAGCNDGETCSLILSATETTKISVPEEDADYYNSILQIVTDAAS